ncbi:hypothetical protein [Variovorax sp. KK3]|uniref:hypothetical protein n=1 Tax=Variovorax sp. KK3 TaxID=1855728 RepID=UPI00117C85DC|nr:hypothetical protein [Variovorax sp. KK3]
MPRERTTIGTVSEEPSDRSRLAPLNPAHLTHEPWPKRWSWTRFVGGAALGALVVEALRRIV